ncbi:peroxisomal 2,4dienoyl-coa reductase [Acanthamoeba castellanii str. Neff]|uniref:2,4-dienoyl-CoA reductase [(3E)-enoyl-CoA-producing] n=1 Tax=Acanthamoeba castellanii (strain ATCC 30010 / Neff) TaxID=1257118 RepID=L8HLB6_ACACF|nr:peroxisomal 2,4dienoyl-coa reductase [Acanthamoeba castellanii str. Neff]ELR25166.1 peroxisomal 2,4dienoyl-coa reductase [Acanthamoeba castellanii str. Neff]
MSSAGAVGEGKWSNAAVVSPFRRDLLRGKAALVTGGATGIGFAITRALALHGARVAIVGRRADKLEEAVNQLKADGVPADGVIGLQGDVRSYESLVKVVQATTARFGQLDILVNNAAGNFLCPAKDLTPNGFKTVIDIDLVGTFNASRAAYEALKATKAGVIINISATLHYGATPWQLHASSAKAAIDALTRNLGLEWGPDGIRTVGIAPGPIQGTEGLSRLSGMSGDEVGQRIPVRRAGYPEDIAFMAVYLASGAGSFVNGTTVVVDGGATLWRPEMVSEEQLKAITASLRGQSSSKKKAAL